MKINPPSKRSENIFFESNLKSISKETKEEALTTISRWSKSKQRQPQLKIIKQIGKGCFGVVFHAIYQGEITLDVAWKRMHKNSKNQSREYEILTKLKGKPHCVQLIDFFYSRMNSIYKNHIIQNFIMELCSGNLESLLKKKQKNLVEISYDQCRKIIYQTLLGVKNLHDENICHRDLKPENVFYNGNIIKIGDLGSSKQLKDFDSNTPYVVSRYYRAPELIIGIKAYSHNIDIFSVGVMLYELLTGILPFKGQNEGYQFIEIFKHLGPPSKETQELYRILIGWNGKFTNVKLADKTQKSGENSVNMRRTISRASKNKSLKGIQKFHEHLNKMKFKENKPEIENSINKGYKRSFLKCKEQILQKVEISPLWTDDYELLFKIIPHRNCFKLLKHCKTPIRNKRVLVE
jgi:glycogen synthase kinase 3 beta